MFFVDEQYERLNNKKIDCLSCIVKIGSLMDKETDTHTLDWILCWKVLTN